MRVSHTRVVRFCFSRGDYSRCPRSMEFTGIVAEFIVLTNAAIVFASSGSPSPPSNCEPRQRPDNGQVVFTASKNWMRAVEVYQCNSGYVLTGQTKHTCVGGEWSGNVPSCATAGYNKIVGSTQDWFSFRRILRHDGKRKQRNNEKQSENKSTDNIETPLQTQALGNAFRLPQQMIRDSVREYSEADYDLSCLFKKRHGKNFLRAPKLPYAHVVKYSKKKNTDSPNNKYLVANYHCIKGHVLENPSENRLYCSNGHWVGVRPSCVPKTTPMTMYQMECYIKCPPDKNVTLAEGAKSIDFEVERPTTNYDWDRFGTLSSGWNKNSLRTLAPGLYVITYTVRDDEDVDIASCRTTVTVTDDEVPTVRDCPLYLEVIKDFSRKKVIPVTWPEPHFTDNVAVTHVVKKMEPSRIFGPGIYNVSYVAMDPSRNEAICKFTVVVKDRVTIDIENQKTNETLKEVIAR